MPKPANNTFYGDVTVSFDGAVSKVVDAQGNESLNQQVDGKVILEVKMGDNTTQTITIEMPK